MGITETDDADLSQLRHEHPKASVMVTAAKCAICKQLRTDFLLSTTNRSCADIAFLRLHADQNPVAKQVMPQQAALFFVTYDQGRVVHGDTLHTEQQIRALRHALHRHA